MKIKGCVCVGVPVQGEGMTDRLPAHQVAYARLRDMVLFGDLAPGAAVTIEGLVAELGLGMTPVREAIRRLIAERALQWQGNRRVVVPRLGMRALEDLGYARAAIEVRLGLQALSGLEPGKIAELRGIDARVDGAILRGDVPAYLRANHAFHFTLYAQAGSEVLEGLAASLWLRFGPSLRAVCDGPGAGGLRQPDNHKLALMALDARDSDALERALRADIVQGVANIRAGLDRGLFSGPK